MFDVNKLHERIRETFDRTVADLQRTGEAPMTLFVFNRYGGRELIVPMRDVANSPQAKRLLGETIRGRIKEGDVQAVVMITDSYFDDEMTPEADKIRRGLGMTIEQAANAGLCRKREAIFAHVETPSTCQMFLQEYRRNAGAIELVGAVRAEEVQAHPANLSGFWPEQPRATAQ